MFRKRLLSLLATILLGVTSSPAAALGSAPSAPVDEAAGKVTTVDVAKANGKLAALAQQARDLGDPEVDEELEGVGHLYVDVDPDEGSLTVGVGVVPLGVDERVTLGGSGEEAEEPEDTGASQEEAATQEQAVADHKAEMDAQKADVAASSSSRGGTSRPAFTADEEPKATSGQADAGTGVARSVPAPATAPDADAPSAATDFVNDGQNAWLRVMGVILLAGTGTAWSLAKRHGLA